MLNQKDTNTPNWQKEPSSVATTKPPQPIVISKLFTKNPNLPAQQTTNRIKRVVKTSSAPNKQNRFSLVQRAKSSEPSIKKSPSSNLVSSIASKSTTLIGMIVLYLF
jgi:type III secretory pathway lipoprotein EscJ